MTDATADAGDQLVSDQLEEWLNADEPTTIGSLGEAFGDEILAVACLVLMAPSALPIPTGGATHVFAVIALLCSAQIAIGRTSIWVPARWRGKELGARSTKFVSLLIRLIRRCERISRPRLSGLLAGRIGRGVVGVAMSVFIAAALFSPPFSGLDTLPALGVVLISLGLLLEDAVFVGAGLLAGGGGVGLSITLGAKAAHYVKDLF
jgi:hypothetical protein